MVRRSARRTRRQGGWSEGQPGGQGGKGGGQEVSQEDKGDGQEVSQQPDWLEVGYPEL